MIVQTNIDHLFDLPAPAAMQRGANNIFQGRVKIPHGERLDGSKFFQGTNANEKVDQADSLSWYILFDNSL